MCLCFGDGVPVFLFSGRSRSWLRVMENVFHFRDVPSWEKRKGIILSPITKKDRFFHCWNSDWAFYFLESEFPSDWIDENKNSLWFITTIRMQLQKVDYVMCIIISLTCDTTLKMNSRFAHPLVGPNLTGYFFSHSQCPLIGSQNTWLRFELQVNSQGAPRYIPCSENKQN